MKYRGLRYLSRTRVPNTQGAFTPLRQGRPMGEQDVGIDLHRRRSVIVRMTGEGQVLETVRIDNDPVALSLELAKAGPDPEVVLEATYGWYWAADLLQACGARVHLAHPLGVKMFGYQRVKTDARDSTNLAELLRMDRLPEAWLAPPEIRERSDLFGVAGTRLLDELHLGRAYALRIASLRALLVAYDQEITMLGREIAAALAGDAGYLALQTIPGVGPVLAAIFVAEIGNVHRFAAAPPLCSWAGLTPRHRESDTTVRRGPITKQGPRLVRWAAVKATQRLPAASKQAADFHHIADRAAPGSAVSPPPASC